MPRIDPQRLDTDALRAAFAAGTVAHLAIDLQRHYCDAAFASHRHVANARRGGRLAGLVDDFAVRLRPAASQVWVYHTIGGQQADALCGQVRQPGDVVIGKPGLSAFDRTDLGQVLHHAGITAVLVTGAYKDQCVLQTALHAQRLGYDTIVVDNLTIWSVGANASGHKEGTAQKWKHHARSMLDKHNVSSMRSADVLALLPQRMPG